MLQEGLKKIADSKSKMFFIFCLCFIIGVGIFTFDVKPPDSPKNINYYNGSQMELTGYVSSEPNIGLSNTQYILKTKTGKVLLSAPLYPQYNYGDELQVKCILQDTKTYLIAQGVWSICNRPKILSVSTGTGGSILMKKILWFKAKINKQLNQLWPEPDSSFMAGLLYGSKSGLPKELSDNFSRTGVTHIIAVSGFNISIIVSFLMSILILIGLYRQQAFWVAVFGIILFVIFTGASASVVRAAIMGIIVLLSQYLGRPAQIGNTLVFTAALMSALNPYVLIWDAGFQLSFLATLGLIYLSPIVNSYLTRLKIPEFILENLSTTLAAIIATLPLILFQFGRLSIVAPLVNILILWIIPWLMLFGFVSLVISFVVFPLGQVAAWIAGLGLNYVIMVVNWFGNQSWSAIDIQIPFWAMVLLYILIIYIYVKKNKSAVVRRGV
ncbi:MAG: ComEC/Rec2 family competence protein [Patescibacteria group bacterium]